MARAHHDPNEFGDIKQGSAVADMLGTRQGRVASVLGKGWFRVTWSNGEQENLARWAFRARFTTQSEEY